MTRFGKIKKWNEERNLLGEYQHDNELSFIIEEMIESTKNLESKKARKKAKLLTKVFGWLFRNNTTEVQKVDAYADIIVFATGAILKLGYDADKVIDEVIKELNDRTGTLVDGKFVKDVKKNAYKANFSKCLLKPDVVEPSTQKVQKNII